MCIHTYIYIYIYIYLHSPVKSYALIYKHIPFDYMFSAGKQLPNIPSGAPCP